MKTTQQERVVELATEWRAILRAELEHQEDQPLDAIGAMRVHTGQLRALLNDADRCAELEKRYEIQAEEGMKSLTELTTRYARLKERIRMVANDMNNMSTERAGSFVDALLYLTGDKPAEVRVELKGIPDHFKSHREQINDLVEVVARLEAESARLRAGIEGVSTYIHRRTLGKGMMRADAVYKRVRALLEGGG